MLTALGWILMAALGALAICRVIGTGGSRFGAAAVAATPWALTVALPVLAAAIIGGHPALATAAGALAFVDVLWLLGRWRRWGVRGPSGGDDARPIRLLSANVLIDNHRIEPFAAVLAHLRPDIVVLQELSPWHRSALEARGALSVAAFPWRLVLDDELASQGIGVWSRYPLTNAVPWEVSGNRQIRADLQVPGAASVSLFGLHLPPPWPWTAKHWALALADVDRAARTAKGPVLLAGDLNATWDHRRLRKLGGRGLRDAAREAGRGLTLTWPTDGRYRWPLFRIDHVLVPADVAVREYQTVPVPGSDHRALVVDLLLPPEAPVGTLRSTAGARRGHAPRPDHY